MLINVVIKLICVYVGAIGFGILVNVPKVAWNLGGIVGCCGWILYYIYIHYIGGYIGANVLGALGIGLISMLAAKHMKMPVIIFNIPGLVPLVPGGQAYQVVRNLLMNHYSLVKFYSLQLIFIAGSIAFGFLISELIIQLYFKSHKLKNKKDRI